MRITNSIVAGLLCLAGAQAADASVYYSFTSMLDDGIRSFTLTAPDFITSGTYELGDLDSCTVAIAPSARCVSVTFDTRNGVDTILFDTAPDRVASRIASFAASGDESVFTFDGGTFAKAGSSWDMDEDATLTIRATSAAPEPASWVMMIGGFGLIGAAARRSRTTLRTA